MLEMLRSSICPGRYKVWPETGVISKWPHHSIVEWLLWKKTWFFLLKIMWQMKWTCWKLMFQLHILNISFWKSSTLRKLMNRLFKNSWIFCSILYGKSFLISLFYSILCRSALLYKLDSLLSCYREEKKHTIVEQIAQPTFFCYIVTYKE